MVAISRRSPSISLASWRFNCVMSVPTETKPPSLVRRSLICSQRPSSSWSSKLRAPSSGRPSETTWARTSGFRPAAITSA